MSRNFIFSARKQEDTAQNLNLRCSSDASKRSFGAYRDPDTCRYRLLGARYDDLGACRNELLRGGRYCDVGAGVRELLRGSGCIDVGAGGYSLSQDIGRRSFAYRNTNCTAA